MSVITIYTDGSCSKNPGPGGWACLLMRDGQEKLLSGFEEETTNNRMELYACLQALLALKKPSSVALYTDSQYVRLGMTVWSKSWVKNNWLNAQKKPVKNKDLWQELLAVAVKHQVEWHWVKGHSGDPHNERVDEAARKTWERNDE